MNLYNLKCLYFASKLKFSKIKKLEEKHKRLFYHLKFKKHYKRGKTTKHRKGKIERRLAICRLKVNTLGLIVYYKKTIERFPELLDNLKNFKYDKNIYEFLRNI